MKTRVFLSLIFLITLNINCVSAKASDKDQVNLVCKEGIYAAVTINPETAFYKCFDVLITKDKIVIKTNSLSNFIKSFFDQGEYVTPLSLSIYDAYLKIFKNDNPKDLHWAYASFSDNFYNICFEKAKTTINAELKKGPKVRIEFCKVIGIFDKQDRVVDATIIVPAQSFGVTYTLVPIAILDIQKCEDFESRIIISNDYLDSTD